ncbi:MAG: CaiB/BaiF CoA transferase family protein [Maricaulaceae bacterium]
MAGGLPLAGVRVLDLSRVLAGPFCTQALSDLGADVLKVERPGVGDDTRAWGPPFTERHGPDNPESAYYLAANRGKRSVVLDLKDPADLARARAWATQADVVVANFKPGALERLGLDYATIARANPKVVYGEITGFGFDGPRAQEPGYDLLIQALSGLMSVTGPADGPGYKVGAPVVDLFTGLYAAIAILGALRAAEATGQGRRLDLALFDAATAMLANQATNCLVSGQTPRPLGNAHPSIAPYEPLQCSDGAVIVACGNDGQFQRLCQALAAPALAQDPRFAHNADRVANRPALLAALQAVTLPMTKAALAEVCQAAGVPAGPIQTIAEALADPQARHRRLSEAMPDDQGQLGWTLPGPLAQFRREAGAPSRPAPRLGEGGGSGFGREERD